MPNTEKQLTAMSTLRSKLFAESESIKEDAKTDQYSRGYRNALLWICNDIDSQMLATERQNLIDAYDKCLENYAIPLDMDGEEYFNQTFKTQ